MAELLSGREHFGQEKQMGADKDTNPTNPAVQEQDFLFDKSYTCPACSEKFKAKTVKNSRVKLLGSDLDLRPKYKQLELLKYDVIMCPSCGYTALSRYFSLLTALQAKKIKAEVTPPLKSQEEKAFYTYDDALERYKLTLANANVKQAKSSEKAYICLKTAWLLRSKGEHMDPQADGYAEQKKAIDEEEKEFLHNALDGFIAARQSENFPMCGMDEPTVDYLIAVLSMQFEQYDVSSKMLAGILGSYSASPRVKDKAREVKEMLVQKIKEKNAARK